jgi:hypothetical protein
MQKQWYEQLFENSGLKYDNESFTHGTVGECDFIINYDIKYRMGKELEEE